MLKLRPDNKNINVVPTFLTEEPDSKQSDAPRLDIVVSFADGRSVRYHPRADPIWSDQAQPTDAMQKRYNRAQKRVKKLQSA